MKLNFEMELDPETQVLKLQAGPCNAETLATVYALLTATAQSLPQTLGQGRAGQKQTLLPIPGAKPG
jgi:hypothetical protein